jgi:hypothetical protein
MDSPRFGFTTGLAIRYRLSNRFRLESGLQLADRGDQFRMDNGDWYIPEDQYGIYSQDDPNLPELVRTKYHFYYLGIPLKLNYYLIDKKVKLFLSGGMSIDFFVDEKTKTKYTINGNKNVEVHHEYNFDFSKTNLVGIAGFGVDYSVSKNLQLRFEPIFRYMFTPLLKNDVIAKTNLYSIGANFAIYFEN